MERELDHITHLYPASHAHTGCHTPPPHFSPSLVIVPLIHFFSFFSLCQLHGTHISWSATLQTTWRLLEATQNNMPLECPPMILKAFPRKLFREILAVY